ncbi:hypothetical protein TIFTF001_014271 [Ficus carica]|uniref:Uncharacterized protein n=1 Tax=Ficus carica TaxID=3494 RepID=A0AA88D804_FICCA|nr:hypothetical protein TIFTF001_014271 [Ficus carica]
MPLMGLVPERVRGTLARREARAPIRKSANGVNIMGAHSTRGGSDRASRLVVGCSALRLIVGCCRRVENFRRLGKQPRVGLRLEKMQGGSLNFEFPKQAARRETESSPGNPCPS